MNFELNFNNNNFLCSQELLIENLQETQTYYGRKLNYIAPLQSTLVSSYFPTSSLLWRVGTIFWTSNRSIKNTIELVSIEEIKKDEEIFSILLQISEQVKETKEPDTLKFLRVYHATTKIFENYLSSLAEKSSNVNLESPLLVLSDLKKQLSYAVFNNHMTPLVETPEVFKYMLGYLELKDKVKLQVNKHVQQLILESIEEKKETQSLIKLKYNLEGNTTFICKQIRQAIYSYNRDKKNLSLPNDYINFILTFHLKKQNLINCELLHSSTKISQKDHLPFILSIHRSSSKKPFTIQEFQKDLDQGNIKDRVAALFLNELVEHLNIYLKDQHESLIEKNLEQTNTLQDPWYIAFAKRYIHYGTIKRFSFKPAPQITE